MKEKVGLGYFTLELKIWCKREMGFFVFLKRNQFLLEGEASSISISLYNPEKCQQKRGNTDIRMLERERRRWKIGGLLQL